MKNKVPLCRHHKHIVSEREFYTNQAKPFSGTRIVCKKCGANKFIKDTINKQKGVEGRKGETSFEEVYRNANNLQREQIRLGQMDGVDISVYAKPKLYDWQQMDAIRAGLAAGLDAQVYADPKLNWMEMDNKRQEMLAKI